MVNKDSVMCMAIYIVTKLFSTQLPDDRQVYETRELQQICLRVVSFQKAVYFVLYIEHSSSQGKQTFLHHRMYSCIALTHVHSCSCI